MDENNNLYDSEWEKLREEYKNLIKDSEENKTIDNANNDTTENLDLPKLEITPEPIPDIEEKKEDNKNEIETLKQEKDLNITTKTKKNKKSLNILFKKCVNHMDGILQKISSTKKDTHIYWTEENRKELSTIIVVFLLVMFFLIITLFVFNIPELATKIFNFNKNDDIIKDESIVYVDETKRSFHNSGCSHLIKGMRYLVLEEKYAIQLGYKPCNKYKKIGE